MKTNTNKSFLTILQKFFWDESYKSESDINVSRKTMMINYIIISTTVYLFFFGFLAISQNNYLVGVTDFTVLIIVSIARVVYLKNHNEKLLSYVIINLFGIFLIFLIYSSGVNLSSSLWSYIFPTVIMFVLGRKVGRIYIIAFIIIVCVLFFFNITINQYSINFKLRFLGSFLAVSILSYFIEFIREKTQFELEEKNKEIEKSFSYLEQKEKALTEREKHYRTLFECSNDAIFLMDGSTFIDCNPRTLEMFGCERNEIIGQPPYKFSPMFQPDGILSEEKAHLKINSALTGNSQIFDWTHCKLDGTEFFTEVRLDAIELNNNKLLLASVRDITERKIASDKLKLAKENAEKSDRLKSDFLAQMSHEIRTPINTILNYTSLLQMEFGDKVSEDNSGSFKAIQKSSQRLIRTIDLILNISDVEAGTYEPNFENLNILEKVLEPAANEFFPAAHNKNLYLTLTYPKNKNCCKTKIDIYTIYQAISNLLDNSIKYTDSGGINISIDDFERNFIVKISDTGIGISKEYLPHLFEKFSQEESGYSRKYEGNGLGLSLVKKYCEINNINISVQSEKGAGTTFILDFHKTDI
ncbi:MAG: PAS domain-containing sensor histidine kinase [Ignavibacteriae bacterium]|nr:PAS domain-containing sensor histidine kinase [Ignavibacteriota bacterium]